MNVGTPQNAILRFGIPAGAPGATGPQGIQGIQGIQGATGPAASVIPFSISKYGVTLGTDRYGEPLMIAFSGFAPTYYAITYLQEGEWGSGAITVRTDMHYPTSFIMTTDVILRKIYTLFSISDGSIFENGASIQPFVCLAVSDSDDLVYRILQNTIVYTEPITGGYIPKHTIRRGALINLDVAIPEGALVAIVAGIKGTGVTSEQSAIFSVNGGLYLE